MEELRNLVDRLFDALDDVNNFTCRHACACPAHVMMMREAIKELHMEILRRIDQEKKND